MRSRARVCVIYKVKDELARLVVLGNPSQVSALEAREAHRVLFRSQGGRERHSQMRARDSPGL